MKKTLYSPESSFATFRANEVFPLALFPDIIILRDCFLLIVEIISSFLGCFASYLGCDSVFIFFIILLISKFEKLFLSLKSFGKTYLFPLYHNPLPTNYSF